MARCVTLVQLSVSCEHLIDKDVGSKSDPLCVLFQDVGGGRWAEVSWTTERLQSWQWGVALVLGWRVCCRVLIGFCPQLGRTERVRNCSSPEFSKTLQLEYHFETVQKLRFGVYDIDNKTPELGDDDFLGGAECSLGQVCGTRIVDSPHPDRTLCKSPVRPLSLPTIGEQGSTGYVSV